ncbi:MAG: hypothetical protein DRH06_10595 [Deltaproteobacteria bacterium]|nr:MAG: hypothetical protein DRH06_10595 [Deltaproteobacteria bacterium]
MNIFVGCVTYLHNQPNRYFNIEMSVDNYPTKDDRQDLVDFLQPHTAEIIDDVVYIVDIESQLKVWEIK